MKSYSSFSLNSVTLMKPFNMGTGITKHTPTMYSLMEEPLPTRSQPLEMMFIDPTIKTPSQEVEMGNVKPALGASSYSLA